MFRFIKSLFGGTGGAESVLKSPTPPPPRPAAAHAPSPAPAHVQRLRQLLALHTSRPPHKLLALRTSRPLRPLLSPRP